MKFENYKEAMDMCGLIDRKKELLSNVELALRAGEMGNKFIGRVEYMSNSVYIPNHYTYQTEIYLKAVAETIKREIKELEDKLAKL